MTIAKNHLDALVQSGLTKHEGGDIEGAAASYKKALAIAPDHPEALHLFGVSFLQTGQLDDARSLIERAIAVNPTEANYHYNLGVTLQGLGDLAAAEGCFRSAISLDSNSAGAWNNLGIVLLAQSKFSESADAFRETIRCSPSYGPAWVNLAGALIELDDAASALEMATKGTSLAPDLPESHYNLARAHQLSGDFASAEACYREALACRPDYVDALVTFSSCLIEDFRPSQAAELAQQALALEPDQLVGLNNLGLSLLGQERNQEALTVFEKALALAPDDATCHNNLAYFGFATDRFDLAWDEYEWGFAAGERGTWRDTGLPTWNGEPDAKLFAWREQGIGDEIRFASIYPDLSQDTADTVISCDPRLKALFQRSFPGLAFIDETDPVPEAATHAAPIGSLGRFYRRTTEAFPSRDGYLSPDPERVRHWQERLAELAPGPKLGFGWSSKNAGGKRSSIFSTLRDWHHVLETPDVTFVSLQYGDRTSEISSFADQTGIRLHVFDDLDLHDDLEGLAALAKVLDGAVGTAGAGMELASAVGCRVIQVRPKPINRFFELAHRNRDILWRSEGETWPEAAGRVRVRLDSYLQALAALE